MQQSDAPVEDTDKAPYGNEDETEVKPIRGRDDRQSRLHAQEPLRETQSASDETLSV